MKYLSLKTAILIALTTAKRISEIHAHWVSPECAHFDGVKVVLKLYLAFIPKNCT